MPVEADTYLSSSWREAPATNLDSVVIGESPAVHLYGVVPSAEFLRGCSCYS